MDMNAKIFISHSSNDRKVAKSICTALEHRGLVCWIASRDVGPGQNYMDAIVRAIRDARVMVLVFSQNANNSDEILKELSLASKYKVNVIPARIEDVVPSEAFELEFATRQWIDLFDDWEHEIERLTSWIISIVSIERNTDAVARHAGTAVHPGSPPIPKPPQTPIVENRSQLFISDAETPAIQKKEEPLPSNDATKSPSTSPPEPMHLRERAAQESTTVEPQVQKAPQLEASPLASPQKMKLEKSASKPIYWGAALGVLAIGLMWGGWVIAEQRAEQRAKETADAAYVAAQAPICAEKFKRAADAKVNLMELRKVSSWEREGFIRKGGWANDYAVASACAELLLR